MPWSGGVYTRGYPSWSTDAASNLPISATKFDTEDNDFAAGLNNTLTKDGLSIPNTAITWGLTSAQVLALTRGSDGTVFSIGRTGGSNNPIMQFQTVDGGKLVTITNSLATGVLGLNTNATQRIAVNGDGTIVVQGPDSGIALTVNGNIAATTVAKITTSNVGGSSTSPQLLIQSTASNGGVNLSLNANSGTVGTNDFSLFVNGTTRDVTIMNRANSALNLGVNGTNYFSMAAAGNITLAAPSSGIPFQSNSGALAVATGDFNNTSATVGGYITVSNSGTANCYIGAAKGVGVTGGVIGDFGIRAAGNIQFIANGGTATMMQIGTAGNVIIVAPTAAVALTITPAAANRALILAAGSTSAFVCEMQTGTTAGTGLFLNNNAAAGSAVFRIDGSATTGAQTATFTATNKPGSGTTSPSSWLPVNVDGAVKYIPMWL